MSWYLKVLRNYVGFSGRARRKEYWMFTLFNAIAFILLSIIDGIISSTNSQGGFGMLSSIYLLAVFLPSIAVTTRRLHDTDRSGWWQLLLIIPVIGTVVVLVFTAMDGTRGDNRFGADPKAGERL